ncbi:unnamed protein product [Brachionus calyciflorus]|uniref:Potassium channel domain-containing protein n=1 Tax=Brachionus calyciflorus TaxID=104777 RepID=A0A813M6Q1_9BILA|nr:unnamed protein product [Brachionus calyciflorus]
MGVSLYLVLNNKLLRPTQRTRILLLAFIFLIYLFLGAYIFQRLNLPIELQERKDVFEYKKNFLQNHKCIDETNLNNFIEVIENAKRSGIAFVENSQEFTPNWSFDGETFFFVLTTLTTIGYGQTAPLTENGRLFTIFYIVLGVPLTMLLLTLIVDRLEFEMTKNITRNRLMEYLNQKKYAKIPKDFASINSYPLREEPLVSKQKYIYLQTFKVGFLLIVLIYLIPSYIFTYIMEPDWSFLDSLYYCYISVTTIGFGDMVPGESYIGSKRKHYKLAVTFYLLFGVVMNMLFLNMFIRLPLMTKIHKSWLKLKRRKLFNFGIDNDDFDENGKDSDSNDKSSKNSSNSSKRSSPVLPRVNTIDEIVAIESEDRHTYNRNNTDLYSPKAKNM